MQSTVLGAIRTFLGRLLAGGMSIPSSATKEHHEIFGIIKTFDTDTAWARRQLRVES
jgi:hypothetical protein